jgi:tetratricopeptide (TPR) repeat protein
VQSFTRADLLRILRVTPRQLGAWERAGLVASAGIYTFADLLQIKKISELCASRVRPATIRQSLEAMQKQVSGMSNPLLEATAVSNGSRVAFRHKGRVLEPLSGQFVMDFSAELNGTPLTPMRAEASSSPKRNAIERMKEQQIDAAIAELFSHGIALEEDPARQAEAIQAYERVLDLEPDHAPAHINLGTLFYNRQEYAESEFHYRRAVEIDPRYALAYFDLGNVLDETGRVLQAIEAYRNALHLAPTYADANYNLALAYEKIGEPRKALAHWKAYIKLDRSGPWSTHARHQIRKILAADSLKLVYRKRS